MIPFDDAVRELRASFDVPAGALDRCEEILEVQHIALRRSPPMARLPESVRIAAASRMRGGLAVIPRERVPIDARRVAELVRALARTLLEGPSDLDEAADAWVEAALPPAVADDGEGVRAAASRLGLEPDVAVALLREGLKPEMLRTSAPFGQLAKDAGSRRLCPLCAECPCAATEAGEACCRFCGLVFPWDASCGACGQQQWRMQELAAIVRHARLRRCAACGESVPEFRVPGDALLLSICGVLTAPFKLALHVGANDAPRPSFPVF